MRMEDLESQDLENIGLSISRAIPQESAFYKVSEKILSKEGYAAQMLGPNWENNDNTVEVHEYQLPESKALRKLSIKRST